MNRPGFDLKEQFRAFVRVIAHIAFAAGILLASEGLRRVIGMTLTDAPGREIADGVVNIVTVVAASFTALGSMVMSMVVYIGDLHTDLTVRLRYNREVRSGQLTREDSEGGEER